MVLLDKLLRRRGRGLDFVVILTTTGRGIPPGSSSNEPIPIRI